MAYCRQRDFLFCDLCGTMLHFEARKRAKCPLCDNSRSLKGIAGRETSYIVTNEDIRRTLNIESIVDHDELGDGEAKQQTTNQTCPKCKHTIAEFVARQMRSADEGQTIIYTCAKCRNTWSENT